MSRATHSAPAALGLRIPRSARPAVAWGHWQVVARTHGWHVSRESASGGRTEALTNEVGKTRIFRKLALAERACARANFEAGCVQLAREPLLGGGAARTGGAA